MDKSALIKFVLIEKVNFIAIIKWNSKEIRYLLSLKSRF